MGKTPDDRGFKFEWERKVAQCRLGAATKSVASWLSHHAETHGRRARPGIRRLAFETELSERTVRRSLDYLRELGLIVRVVKGSTANRRHWADEYELAIPADLETQVRIETQPPGQQHTGYGKGGVANHVRWHERRNKSDPSCVHCTAESTGSLLPPGSAGPEAGFRAPIRPVAKRSPTTGQTDADQWSVGTHQQGSTNKDELQNSARSLAGPRASSRARDLPLFAEFFEAQWNERVAPGEKLTKDDVAWLEHEIAYDYVIECIGGEDFYPGEESAIFGRLANGDNPKAIVNMILSQREAA